MKKLKTKLTETRACPFYEDVIGTVCFALISGALGWVAVKYKCTVDLIQKQRKVNDNWAKLYRLVKDNYDLIKDMEDRHTRSIKNGLVYVDGEWYRTEKLELCIVK